jgi:hypothetical protein
VIWYRLRQTNVIDANTFHASWNEWSRWLPPPNADEGGGGGPVSADRVIRDYGTKLPDLFLRASRHGYLGDLDVAQYLGVRPDVIPAIEQGIGAPRTIV